MAVELVDTQGVLEGQRQQYLYAADLSAQSGINAD